MTSAAPLVNSSIVTPVELSREDSASAVPSVPMSAGPVAGFLTALTCPVFVELTDS